MKNYFFNKLLQTALDLYDKSHKRAAFRWKSVILIEIKLGRIIDCKMLNMKILKVAFVLVLLIVVTSAKAQYNSDIKIEKLLKTDTTSIGQHIVYPSFSNDEVTIAKFTIPPGKSTGWHLHNFPVFAYVLQGTLTVDVRDGKSLVFPVNSTFAEVINVYHNGINNGCEDLVLIAFFMGEKGKALSEH